LHVLLEARNLRKYFPIKKSFRQLFKSGVQQNQPDLVVKAVDDVSFILEQGKVLVIAGASGSGRTTTVAKRT
jgi:ABC-type oligopeptide transport system ATPase subunit